MDKKIKTENDWINSLLTQENLLQPKKQSSVDLKYAWTQIEECQLAERISKIVADINEAAGYHVLDLLDFLPPQTTILRVKYSKRYTDYVFAIVAREGGVAVVFSSLCKVSTPWKHFFRNQSRSRKRSTSLELDIHPAEILSDDYLQKWFFYLLSEFNNKFKPHAAQPLSEKEYTDFIAAFRKASA